MATPERNDDFVLASVRIRAFAEKERQLAITERERARSTGNPLQAGFHKDAALIHEDAAILHDQTAARLERHGK